MILLSRIKASLFLLAVLSAATFPAQTYRVNLIVDSTTPLPDGSGNFSA